jgi:excisionase family DNA binding protein
MSLQVPTLEEFQALAREVAELKRRVEGGVSSTDRAFLTPKQVAKRLGVGNDQVYAALKSGRLKADSRPGMGKAAVHRIQPADAQAWYDAFVAKANG